MSADPPAPGADTASPGARRDAARDAVSSGSPPGPPRRGRRVPRRRRRTWLAVGLVAAVPLALVAAVVGWLAWQLDPPGSPGEPVAVRVERGWGVSRIGDELADHDVIGSSLVFQAYVRLRGSTDFQAGQYELRRDLGVRGAVEALGEGPRIDYVQLRVPPGLWIEEIADRVGALPGRDRVAFLDSTRNGSARSRYQPPAVPEGARNPLEGLLWPDTYRVSDAEDEIALLQHMVDQFDARADAIGLASATTGGLTPYQIVVVASLVEAEAKVDADRPLIASVIYNRLREGMPLQIDATLLYARGEPDRRTITEADQQAASPFNTYLNTGLPPTPIAGVTEASLRAAMAPASTDFLFYVIAGADGSHAFARTFEEHRANIERARAQGLL